MLYNNLTLNIAFDMPKWSIGRCLMQKLMIVGWVIFEQYLSLSLSPSRSLSLPNFLVGSSLVALKITQNIETTIENCRHNLCYAYSFTGTGRQESLIINACKAANSQHLFSFPQHPYKVGI